MHHIPPDMRPHGYTVPQLREALAFAKAHPAGTIRVHWAPWPGTFTGTEWRRWFRQCLDRKINRQFPVSRGRKDTPDWFMEQCRASRQLNQPRLIIHWLPPDLTKRFAHRLRSNHADL
jgi:hypothetical protein